MFKFLHTPGRLVAILAVALCASGCGKPREGLINRVDEPHLNEIEVYWRVIDQSPVFANAVQNAADSIIKSSTDPIVRRRALLWKINAIPAAQNAIFRIDPVVGLLDAWTLCVQMTDFFDTGNGKDAFGVWQPMVLETCRELEANFALIGTELAGDVSTNRGRNFVDEWAKSHRIEDLTFTRESTRVYWANLVRQGGGVMTTVETMGDALRVAMDRMDASYLLALKQALWQVELLVHDDLLKMEEIEGLFENLERVAAMDRDVTDIARDIDTIETEFGILQRDFAAIVDSINAYWLTATTAVQRERLGMELLIDDQRTATFADLEAMAGRVVDNSVDKLTAAAGRMVVPAIIAVLLVIAGPFVLGYFVGRRSSARPGNG